MHRKSEGGLLNMAEIKNENYITIQAFMTKDLELSGNELVAYALIYGFSQDGESCFKGSLSYVSEWLNCSRATACSVLNKLADDGFLEKKEKIINGVKLCDYIAIKPNKETLKGIKERKKERKEKEKAERYAKNLNTNSKNNNRRSKNLNGGIQKTLNHNNTDILNDIKDDNIGKDNSKANSFFAKKVADRNKIINPPEIDQNELINRINKVADRIGEEVFTEEQTESVKSCMIYFVEKYARVFNKKHPILGESAINDVIANITRYAYVEHENFTTCFDPLVSEYEDDEAYKEIIDMYFKTEFKQEIDYSIVHFSQKNVLIKLMGKANEKIWFTNE